MTDTLSGLIVMLPLQQEEALHWWHVEQGRLVHSGQAQDILAAAGLTLTTEDVVLCLVPTGHSSIGWHEFAGLAARQAEAAARLEATASAISSPDHIHVSSATADPDAGVVMTAIIANDVMSTGIARLQAQGIDPDYVVPVELVAGAPFEGFVEMVVGAEAFLRGNHVVLPDEFALRQAIVGDADVKKTSLRESETALVDCFFDPPINLRQGKFAKKGNVAAATARDWKRLFLLLGLAALFGLAISAVLYLKYHMAVAELDRQTLVAARKIVPDASDAATVESFIDQELTKRGVGGAQFGALSASLLGAMKPVPSVTVRQMNFRNDGVLAVRLAAPQADAINKVLIAIQRDGFRITANSRQEANGELVADITMRGS